MIKILVTGGSGYLSLNIANFLRRNKNYEIIDEEIKNNTI